MIIWYSDGFNLSYPFVYSFIHDIAVRYLALMTVVSIFFGYREKMSGNTAWSSALRQIGRRTLDIYMIHYFLIPDLSGIAGWLDGSDRIILQILIASVLTAAIVAVCMLVSLIIRRSKFLEAWLFGVKGQ